MDILVISSRAPAVLAVLAGLIGLVRFRHLPPSLRALALLACFDALMELTMVALHWLLGYNLFMFPIILVGEVGLMSLAYRQVLQSATFNRALPWALSFFALYAFVIYLAGAATPHYTPATQVVSDLLMLGMAALYFRKLLVELRVESLRREPFFWLSVCITVYALGDLQISLFSNFLLTHYSSKLQLIVIWGVRNLFNIQLYVCYGLVLWKFPLRDRLLGSQPGGSPKLAYNAAAPVSRGS